MAIAIRDAARSSIGTATPAKALELKHTIRLINVLTEDIDDAETAINKIMDTLASPITTIPGIKKRMGAMILAEIRDFSRFDNPDQILAYAGLSPSTYQSGQLTSSYAHMEKRGSRYLRYALFNATQYVSGIQLLKPILLKSGLKESIITLRSLMPARNLSASSIRRS